jgi:hypothetical protein
MRSAAVALVLLTLVSAVAALVLSADPALSLADATPLAFSAVGLLLAVRRERNPIGWIFLAIGLATEASSVGASLNIRGRDSGSSTFLAILVLTMSGLWAVEFSLIPLLLLVFPTGTVPSRRWGWAPPAIVIDGLILVVLSGDDAGRSAFVVAAAPLLGGDTAAAAAAALRGPLSLAMMGFFLVSAASLVVRARRGSPTERQQIKWVGYAGALLALTVVGTSIVFFSPLRSLDPLPTVPAAMFGGIPLFVSFVALPVAVGIAIFRYRLYDIDVLIRRTIVYAAMTLALGAVFVGSVLVVEGVLRRFTSGSELAVAASTLATLALFQPIRRQVQDAVDRRFYRSRYDAARTLDAFAIRLRDEVDLDAVRRDLVDAVERTVQPAHASVWLRGAR